MPKTRPVTIGGQTHQVGRVTMADIDAFDDFLATLPRPEVSAQAIDALRRGMEAVVGPILAVGLDGVEASQQAVHLLNLRTQLARAAGDQLNALDVSGDDWPLQFMSPEGSRLLMRLPAGRVLVAFRALASGGQGVARGEAEAIYAGMTSGEFADLQIAYFGDQGEEEPEGPKGGDAGASDSAETTSTTPSAAPTAGAPSVSTP